MVIIDTGWIYPAVFDDNAKGPMHDLRGAKSLHGPHEMMNIYEYVFILNRLNKSNVLNLSPSRLFTQHIVRYQY